MPEIPELPTTDGKVEVPVQSVEEGEERSVTVYVRYPGGSRANVQPSTGLALCLHNWGGTGFRGAPVPDPREFDLVIVGVDYYQSGDEGIGPLPYDYGYVQAADALRGLHFVFHGLQQAGKEFDRARLYALGGSGGANVALMANKLAPRTFACVVDCSGMASLTDEIAFGLPGGSTLDARYRRDPESSRFLRPAEQEIRDLGHAGHLAQMVARGNSCTVVVIHGEDDPACLVADKRRMVEAMGAAGVDVEAHFVSAEMVDGDLLVDSGHTLGDRTRLTEHFAGKYLRPGGSELRRLTGPSDFERRETITYAVTGGIHNLSYELGYPVLGFAEA